MAKKLIASVFLGVFLVLSAGATTVSFCVIETGLPVDGAKSQQSLHWENALLDVFFDAGYIVTNSPILRLDSKPSGDIKKIAIHDINEAMEGGANYLIIAQLDYVPGSLSLSEVSLFMFSAIPYQKIHERRIQWNGFRSQKDEFDNVKKIIGELVPQIRAR